MGFEKRTKFERENPRSDAVFGAMRLLIRKRKKLAYASKAFVESVAISSRYCKSEQENSRFLGYENDAIKKNEPM